MTCNRFFAFAAGSRSRASALLLGSLLLTALVAAYAHTALSSDTKAKTRSASTAPATAPTSAPAAPGSHDAANSHATRDTHTHAHTATGAKVQTSKIWKPEQEWTTTVWENTAGVAPTGGTSQWYATAFAFRLESAPTTKRGEWLVLAYREGAEGPFAAGWELTYRSTASGTMRLTGVAMADGPKYAPRYADVVLGGNFPLQPTIAKPVRNSTIKLS